MSAPDVSLPVLPLGGVPEELRPPLMQWWERDVYKRQTEVMIAESPKEDEHAHGAPGGGMGGMGGMDM